MIDDLKGEPPVAAESPSAGESARWEKAKGRRRARVGRNSVAAVREKFFRPLPQVIWWVALALAALGVLSPNPVLTPFCILILPVLASMLWIQGEPPVLLFACFMQWVASTTAVLYTDFYGQSLKGISGGPALTEAVWLCSIGVLVLGIGMRLALLRRKAGAAEQSQREAKLLRPVSIFVWYLIAFVVFYFVGKFASMVPSLRQPIQATATLRWVMLFLVAYSVVTQRRYYSLLGIAVVLELFTGVLGYFAGFKSVFFILLIVLPTARFLFRGWKLVQFIAVGTFVLFLAIVWTVIKPDYREFLNQGSGQQEVLVPVSERVDKLEELVGSVNRVSLEDGLENLIMRLSYVNYFALSIMNVPENIPHEHGTLWFEAIRHPLMPRFLFPNKPMIDDSVRTAHYTGVEVAGDEQGTSICIGYMGESYIDFGPMGMFVPIVLLGLFYGFIYRFFVDRCRDKVIGFGMAVAILAFGASDFGSNIKLVGGNMTAFLVMATFARFGERWLWGVISGEDVSPTRLRLGGKEKLKAARG